MLFGGIGAFFGLSGCILFVPKAPPPEPEPEPEETPLPEPVPSDTGDVVIRGNTLKGVWRGRCGTEPGTTTAETAEDSGYDYGDYGDYGGYEGLSVDIDMNLIEVDDGSLFGGAQLAFKAPASPTKDLTFNAGVSGQRKELDVQLQFSVGVVYSASFIGQWNRTDDALEGVFLFDKAYLNVPCRLER
ncbi:MAG: hypothetical protein AAGA48_32820 [Myxococcota bacterium]